MSDKAIPSVDEIISTLKNTSLPTVIIEGIDDVIVYRRLEDIFSDCGLSVMPVHGRNNVLKVFDRMAELANHDKIGFIADRDVWVVSGVPNEYDSNKIIFTDGYSVENDIFRDCDIRTVMEVAERRKFSDDLDKYSKWFALAIQRVANKDDDAELKTFVGRVIDNDEEYKARIALREGEAYPESLLSLVQSDMEKYLRGKSLMQIASRQLMRKGRIQKINPEFFLGVAPARPGPLLKSIFSKVGNLFGMELERMVN